MAHRGVIVAELSEVNGWGGASSSTSVRDAKLLAQSRVEDKDAKVVAMGERELRRLRLRVERESAAAAKAVKAEAAQAAKLKEARIALERFESAEGGSFSSLSDDAECSFAPRIGTFAPSRRPQRHASPARVQKQQQEEQQQQQQPAASQQPQGGQSWMRKLDGVPPVAQPNYTRARSPVSRQHTPRSASTLSDKSQAPSPEHGDRFQAFGGKLDEQVQCTFSPSTNPSSAKIAKKIFDGQKKTPNRLIHRFDQRTVIERRKTVSSESIECTFTPRLNAGPTTSNEKFAQRLANDLAKRAENKQKRTCQSHYVSGDESLGIEHGGVNRGFRAKSPGKAPSRSAATGTSATATAVTAQSIVQHASRMTEARSPLSFSSFPPRDLSPHTVRRDQEKPKSLSPGSSSRQHRNAFRYRDRYDEHGRLHSDDSSEESEMEKGEVSDESDSSDESPTHRVRDHPTRPPSKSPAVLQLDNASTEASAVQSPPTRTRIAQREHDDADHEAKCSALELAIRTIEDAIESDPDNMQLLSDLQHLHQEHVKAVNAAMIAKTPIAAQHVMLTGLRTPRADSAARLTDRTI